MKLSVVIPAAGRAKRMKSYGPKALIKVSARETVVGRQIRLVRQVRPDAEVVVVTGYQSDRMVAHLPDDVVVVENRDFDDTNVARSLALGLAACKGENALVLYGDIVFNTRTILPSLHESNTNRSSVVVDSKGQIGGEEVGVNASDGRAIHFSYGLPRKWAQIAYLARRDKELFVKLASAPSRSRLFGFEIINLLLAEQRLVLALEPYGLMVSEIDSAKDIEQARLIASCGD